MRILFFATLLACREPQERADAPPRTSVTVSAIRDAGTDASPPARPFELMACRATVLGHTFRGAAILCLAFQAASITSIALDDPTRRVDAVMAVDTLVDQALDPAARRGFPPSSVLYRGLVALMLAGLERLSPDNPRTPFFDELAAALARDLEAGWLPSYKHETYPCDHAPAASALGLHSVLRGSSSEAADHLAGRLRRALAKGFPTSTVNHTERASTLAFAAAFLLPGEPDLAARFADRFVTFCDRGLVTACREWREPHRADTASGPIVAGYSVGATALGLPATRMLSAWHDALERTAIALGANALDEDHPLEAALFRFGQTVRTWQ
jgi:hypothetical protein